jgi:nucleoid-associated protein YgaU
MRSLAVWSALGGGAVCAVVAGVAVERMGGIESVFGTLQESVAPASNPQVATRPSVSGGSVAKAPKSDSDKSASLASDAGAPAFDVVRVEPSGETVVAGHAAPHAAVELRDNGRPIAHLEADASGQFVIIPDALTAGEHNLQLVARTGDGPENPSPVASVKVEAVVAAIAKPVPASSPVPAPRPSPSAAASVAPAPAPTPVAASPQPTASVVAVSSASSPAAVVTPLAVAASPLVAANPPLAPSSDALRISAAKPNELGGLQAQGTAQPGSTVRLRLNGSYIAEVVADALGRWSLTIERGLTAGFYALRAETLDSAGKAKGAADLAFAYAPQASPGSRPAAPTSVATAPDIAAATHSDVGTTKVAEASPGRVADPSHAVVAEIRTTTVVRGDNLWDLARHFYGDGLRYADIFQANAALIHNPSLIYIGQVFVVPQSQSKTR